MEQSPVDPVAQLPVDITYSKLAGIVSPLTFTSFPFFRICPRCFLPFELLSLISMSPYSFVEVIECLLYHVDCHCPCSRALEIYLEKRHIHKVKSEMEMMKKEE